MVLSKPLSFRFVLRAAMMLATALVLVLSASVPAFAAEQEAAAAGTPLTPETAEAFLDEFFASDHIQPFFKGAAVVIVKDGETIAQKGYGFADEQTQTAVDPAGTVFRVASVSKTFTALAVMQLAEQGKIDLNEDIQTYLPGIEIVNPFDTPVTVAHLLTHRSGLEVRDPRTEDIHSDFERRVTIEEYVQKHMPPVVREPGTSYMYDNFAFLLLGLIVQNVSEQPFEQYMEAHVFQPLAMNNSSFEPEPRLLEQLATGYDAALQPMEPYMIDPTVMPHGGMLSTAEDMGKFIAAFLNEGAAGTERILSASSVEAMSVYRYALHPLLPETTYGFEAAIQLPLAGSSEAVLTKAGDLPGNSSLLLLIPEQETGVFLTYNTNGPLRDLFYSQFMAAFFPEYVTPAVLEETQLPAAEQLQALAGLYADLRLPVFVSSVTVNPDGSLTISDALVGPRNLQHVDGLLFVDEMTQRFTAFHFDDANATVYMNDPFINPLGHAQKGKPAVGFADVEADSAYAPFILGLQSLGHYDNEEGASFHPEQPVTRAELVYRLLDISGLEGTASDTYAFSDLEGHPLAPYVQTAFEMGMVSGYSDGTFRPDRPATRQDAAVMVWNVFRQQYPGHLFTDVVLAGETDEWAVPAVQMMIKLGLHGPEVVPSEDGSVDFRSRQPLTRQEEAALLYQLLLQPVDVIVANLMQMSASETQPSAEAEAATVE